MNLNKLAWRGVSHHCRTNLAATLGIAIAVAVLTGALTVGYSVRESLKSLASDRIGNTRFALTSSGFFREALTSESPLIALEAAITHEPSGRLASRVAVYGVDERFFQFHQKAVAAPRPQDFLLSAALAKELASGPGDGLLLRVPRISAIPLESLHGRKEDPGRTIRGSMREVISRRAMGEFSLRPQQGPVRAVFVSLKKLQLDLQLNGRVNLALSRSPELAEAVRRSYQLADIGMSLRSAYGSTMVERESMILSDPLVQAVKKAAPAAQPVLTYLANTIRVDERSIPYSLITGIDHPLLKKASDIVLNDWAARELRAKVGDPVELEYFLWDPSGRLITQRSAFQVAGIVPIDPGAQQLAPIYPGISDAESLSDWDPPFPMQLGRIRPADEEYWEKYKATPKAFVMLAAAQGMWRSRYGEVTSMRAPGVLAAERLRDQIDPLAAGLSIEDVAEQNRQASAGTTDFGEYFLYFSFFLICSALLLAGLFFRLGIESRTSEIESLRAVGFSIAQVRSLLLREGVLVGLAGSVLGTVGSVAYAALIMAGLGTWWIDAVGTSDLQVYISPLLLVAGLLAGLAVTPVAIFLSLRSLGRSPRAQKHQRPWLRYAAWASLPIAIALVFVGGPLGFFGAGALLLFFCLQRFSAHLKRGSQALSDVRGLGLRYASYRPGRSVLCATLIASATFLIVATNSFRRTGSGGEPGYRFLAESSLPLFYDPNNVEGREALNLPPDPPSRWLSFRLRPGDDASCLNLYRPTNPRVLGAPSAWLKPEWKLEQPIVDGVIPAAVDANSLTYVLHSKVGDVLTVGDKKLRIVTALSDSIFQGEVVVSEEHFKAAYPEEQGYRVFLIDAPEGAEPAMEKSLSDYGLDVTSTEARKEAFHRVENTYLTTFQLLGALGLLIGTIGLGTVLLRNVLERRRELAVLRTIGYTQQDLRRMILAENLLLLVTGVGIGILCAGIAVLPITFIRGGTLPFASILALLLAVVITGVLASAVALRAVLRSPMLDALRSE